MVPTLVIGGARVSDHSVCSLPTIATLPGSGKKSLATTTLESLSPLMGFKSVIGYGRHPPREPKLGGDGVTPPRLLYTVDPGAMA
jgi:hypothetical protein